MPRRILVTGGTGFVGANLVRRLLADGHAIHLLLRRNHLGWRLDGIRDDVEVHLVELTDADGVSTAVATAKPDWIFHLAAHGAYSWQQDARQMVDTNITATLVLLETCVKAGFAAFVNAGTSSEYG